MRQLLRAEPYPNAHRLELADIVGTPLAAVPATVEVPTERPRTAPPATPIAALVRRIQVGLRRRLPPCPLLLTLAAVLWSGAFASLEVYRTFRIYANRPWVEEEPTWWRLGSPPVERLQRFLATVDAELPVGSRVVFATPLEGEKAGAARRWAAYLLPRHDLLPPGAVSDADYWIAYGGVAPNRPAVPVLDLAAGALYRLR